MAEPLTGGPAEVRPRGDRFAAAGGASAAPAPSLRAPSEPATAPAAAGSHPLRLFDPKAILLAALVLIVGAALGAAGYAVEQHHSNWLPKPQREGGGWRVADAHGRRFSGLSLCGGHLAWQDGPLILVMDLGSGRIRVVGPGPENGSTWQPAVSPRYVVWFEGRRGATDSGTAFSYDLASRRRRALAPVVHVTSYVAASGELAVWTELVDGRPRLVVLDMSTARRSSIMAVAGEPLIDGDLVATKTSGQSGDAIAALDLATKRQWPVVAGNGGPMTGFGVSGRRVAWGWTDATTGAGRVLVRDVDSGATTLVAAALGLTGPAIGGDIVVWAQRPPDGGDGAVMGRRLGGGPAFRIAAAGGDVEAVQVSGSAAAWLARDAGGRTVIRTVRLPR